MTVRRTLAGVAVTLVALVPAASLNAEPAAKQNRPNIIVIETDDQTQASLAYMPKTRALLGAQG